MPFIIELVQQNITMCNLLEEEPLLPLGFRDPLLLLEAVATLEAEGLVDNKLCTC